MRIAVIGCGAIAETFHLPALSRYSGAPLSVVLVDPDPERTDHLSRRFPVAATARSHRDVLAGLDAAIVATPHQLHVPIALDLVQGDIPVLCEKPLASGVREVEGLLEAAERRGVPVAVNQTRRFIPACRAIREHLREGALGRLNRIEISEGDRFGWPAATPAIFGKRSEGQGVLLDIGVHVFDLIHWWLGEELDLVSHEDDSFGGSEAHTRTIGAAGDVQFDVRLSWLTKQTNRYRLVGSSGTLEWSVYDLDRFSLEEDGASRSHRRVYVKGAPREFSGLADDVLGDFIAGLSGNRTPAVPGRDTLPALRFIETCYGARARALMPWHPLSGQAADAR